MRKQKTFFRCAWVAQSVECPPSAQVTISRFVGSSPASGSVLTAQSLEPASDSVCVCVSLSLPLPTHARLLALSKINKPKVIFKKYLVLRGGERDRMRIGEGKRERHTHTQNPKQAPGSELSAHSLTRGTNSWTVRS